MVEQTEKYDHTLYKYQKDVKDADGVAYAFLNQKKADFFPYKQPKLEPTEIRANMLYSGLCLSDCLKVRSSWGGCPYPIAPGHEIIAEVYEMGSEVKGFSIGQKVGFGVQRWVCDECVHCKEGREQICDSTSDEEKFTYGLHFGGYSTVIQQPYHHFFKIPEKLDIKRAAPLLCAGITVYNPICNYVTDKTKTAAVIGIGGLGHLAVQFLSRMGIEVTCVSRSPDKIDFYKKFGAKYVINEKDVDELKKNDSKFDFIINTAPTANNFQLLLNLTAKAGTFCQVGLPPADQMPQISLAPFILKQIKLVGSLIGPRSNIVKMLDMCAENDIYPMCEEFEFKDFDKAFDKLENGKPLFRCVVKCDDYAKEKGVYHKC
jgi:D-arabinose 1-dehydrogenase-like Zn-dependent alcohol dehydrogenase